MSQLRKIQREAERQEAELKDVPENHQQLPVGKVLTSPVKGQFLTMPLYGWIGRRLKTATPLVMLRCLLVRSLEDMSPVGTIEIELPVFEETERHTVAALERYGWDGRTWPSEPGWPDGDEAGDANMRFFLEQARLKAALTFPPGEQGHALQPVDIQRARGPFLMPPLPAPEREVDPAKLEKLRVLCQNPTMLL